MKQRLLISTPVLVALVALYAITVAALVVLIALGKTAECLEIVKVITGFTVGVPIGAKLATVWKVKPFSVDSDPPPTPNNSEGS